MAQRIARLITDQKVGGSNPSGGTMSAKTEGNQRSDDQAPDPFLVGYKAKA